MPQLDGSLVTAATQAAREDDGWLEYVAAIGTLASAIVAIVALLIAVRSSRDSRRSADAAEVSAAAARSTSKSMEESLQIARQTSGHVLEQVAMQRAEHEAFLAEHARQPKLGLNMRVRPRSPGGRVEKERSAVMYRQLEVAVENHGTRSAYNVSLNVVVPDWLDVRWSHADGGELADAGPPAPADIGIVDAGGGRHKAQYLYLIVNVPPKTAEVQWVRFVIPPNTESIPFRVAVSHPSLDEQLDKDFVVPVVFTD